MEELKKFSTKDLIEELKNRENVLGYNLHSHKKVIGDNSTSCKMTGTILFIKDFV